MKLSSLEQLDVENFFKGSYQLNIFLGVHVD